MIILFGRDGRYHFDIILLISRFEKVTNVFLAFGGIDNGAAIDGLYWTRSWLRQTRSDKVVVVFHKETG